MLKGDSAVFQTEGYYKGGRNDIYIKVCFFTGLTWVRQKDQPQNKKCNSPFK